MAGRKTQARSSRKNDHTLNPAFIEFRRIAREEGGGTQDIARKLGIPAATAVHFADWVIAEPDYVQKGNTPLKGRAVGQKLSRDRALTARRQMVELNAAGMTLKDIAGTLGISYQTIRNWHVDMGLASSRKSQHTTRGEKLYIPPIAYDRLKVEARELLEPENFGRFCTELMGTSSSPYISVPWGQRTAVELLELYMSPEDEYAVLNVFPGSGKSTLLTHNFVAWVVTRERAMGREPTILLGHRTASKSASYVKRLRQTFTHNARLIELYGRFKPSSPLAAWSTEQLLVEPLDWADMGEKESTITAGSYEGSILSGRYSLVIWDDVIDKSNSLSADQRQAVVDWWGVEAETRLNQGGLLLLSNARFGPEDLSQYVTEQVDLEDLDEMGAPRPFYRRIRFKAHYEELCDGITHSGPWPEGCLLDPLRAGWRRIRRQQAANDGRFRLVWQQEDVDPEGNLAEKVWFTGGIDSAGALRPGCFDPERGFGQVTPHHGEQTPLLSAVTIDPSQSRFWSVQHWLAYPDDVDVLYRGVRRAMQSSELLYPDETKPGAYTGILEDWWQASKTEGRPFDYLIFEINIQRGIVQMPFFQEWAASRHIAYIPHETNRVNKHDPDNGVKMNGPRYAFGRVRLPYGGHEEKLYADQFMREACAYPEGSSSDMIMGHWFYTHRKANLIVAEIAEQSDSYAPNAPSWVQRRLDPIPSWARHTESATNLDVAAGMGAR